MDGGVPRPGSAKERRARNLLLSLGSRYSLRPEEIQTLARAAEEMSPPQWEEVVEEAQIRYTAGLLCHHLRAAGVEPPESLKEKYQRTVVSNSLMEAELRRIAPPIRETGVSVLLIKGTALRGLEYGNLGIRPSDDSDWVLRTEQDWTAVSRALKELGYESDEEGLGIAWTRGPFSIELHRNVFGDERIKTRLTIISEMVREVAEEGICRRAGPSPLGEPYLIPAPEDHLLILCVHLMKHNFEPGIWFTDLEALLTFRPEFDWNTVLKQAQAWGLIRPVAYAFRNLGALEEGNSFSSLLPSAVQRTLAEVRPTFLDRILLSFAAEGGRLLGEKEEWERAPVANLLWLSSLNGTWAKVRLLWEAAFPRGEVMEEIYPGYHPALRWWYMLRRTCDLIRLSFRLINRLISLRSAR